MPTIETPDELRYKWFPVGESCFSFKVRCPNDAHLALSSQNMECDPMYEVFLGGWSNTKSVIRRNRQKPDVVEVPTPGIVCADEYRGFWIRWYDNTITVGREGEAQAFMSYHDPYLFPIRFVGICTGWGANGQWSFLDVPDYPSAPSLSHSVAPPLGMDYNPGSAGGTWVPASGGQIPPNPVIGGFDGEHTLFVARAQHNGEVIPGKMHSGYGLCYVPYGGEEHGLSQYEVLCNGSNRWEPVSGCQIPPNAMPAGRSSNGETLFIGRANYEGSLAVGKVQPSHGCCYIPYGGKEVRVDNFEVYTC